MYKLKILDWHWQNTCNYNWSETYHNGESEAEENLADCRIEKDLQHIFKTWIIKINKAYVREFKRNQKTKVNSRVYNVLLRKEVLLSTTVCKVENLNYLIKCLWIEIYNNRLEKANEEWKF